MSSEPQVQVFPQGLEGEAPGGPPTAVVTDRGCRIVLRFAAGDVLGAGDVQELRLLPGKERLRPRALRRFAPEAELHLAYARAAMRIFDSEGLPPGERSRDFRAAGEALRQVAGPGRALPPWFYEQVAREYQALVDGGEPHPVKALAEKHHVTISASSRWIRGARERRYLPKKEAKSAR